MEDPKASQDDSEPRRSPTPGGMYRRAEMRAYAESTEVAAIAAAPAELPADLPSFSAPDIVAAIGHIDPVVRTIGPPAHTAPYIAGSPSVRQTSVPPRRAISIRPNRFLLATIAVGVIAVVWLAWPTPSNTPPASEPAYQSPPAATSTRASRNSETAPVSVTPPLPTSTPVIAQPVPVAPTSIAPGDAPARTSLVDPVLRITSDPAGARVTVNGVGWGATPVVIRHLPPGPKTIRVTKDGYIADQRVVSLSGASAASVQLRLRRSPARPVASSTDIRQR